MDRGREREKESQQMTSKRWKEINREWRKACMPIYIKIFTVVMTFVTIMAIFAIIGAIITGELVL